MKRSVHNLISVAGSLFLLLGGTAVALPCALCGVRAGTSLSDAAAVLCIIAASFLFIIFIVEIVSVFQISDSTMHTVYIALSALGMCVFSPDFSQALQGWGMPPYAQLFDCLYFASFVLLTQSLLYFWNYTYGAGLSKRAGAGILAAAVSCAALYTGLTFVKAEIAALGVYFLFLFVCYGIVLHALKKKDGPDSSYSITEAFFFAACGSALTNTVCELLSVLPLGASSFYSIVFVFLFASEYVAHAMRTDKGALQASEYKLQYERVKAEALRGQINPHFIFNSLAAIQSLYHKSLQDGDHATNLFSRHLRANVEAGSTDFIPFEKELDNIQVYAELENMRRDPPYNVIFDVDATDFSVPVLSLQPYIENAMRYSKANEKEDGFIRISSRRTKDGVVLEICDNGVGFDPDAVPPSSCGIRNSRERFAMLLGVEPKIESVKGEGTVVTIEIPEHKETK